MSSKEYLIHGISAGPFLTPENRAFVTVYASDGDNEIFVDDLYSDSLEDFDDMVTHLKYKFEPFIIEIEDEEELEWDFNNVDTKH